MREVLLLPVQSDGRAEPCQQCGEADVSAAGSICPPGTGGGNAVDGRQNRRRRR